MKKIISLFAAAAALTLTGSCTKLQPSSLEEDVYQHTAELVIENIEQTNTTREWSRGTIIFEFDGRIFSKSIKEGSKTISYKVKCSPAGIKKAKATVNVTTTSNSTATWNRTSMSGSSTPVSIPADGAVYIQKITLE